MGSRRGWRAAGLALAVIVGLCTVPARGEQPQISDAEADAYRYPDSPLGQPVTKPPNPLMSNKAADMLTVTFARSAPRHAWHDSGYTLSVAVLGEPDAKYNYLVGGSFGEDCYLIHFLKAGEIRQAGASCGLGDEWRWIGSIEGSTASIKGNTISAHFSFARAALPPQLKADPEIDGLYAMTCPVTGKSWSCNNDVIDWGFASATTSFKL